MKQSKAIQISVFGILFLISLFIWNYMLVGRNNKGVTETSQATIPLLTVSADGKNINQLHGYQGSVDASLIRDSITPIYENEVKVMLTYAKSDVSVVSYKIYDTDNKTILGNGDTAFHKVKGKKTANIKIKERLENGETLDDILPEAYAVVREAASRVLGMKHYRVQIVGGIILHQGRIAEMRTGEGKTLVSTLPAYLNALEEKGVALKAL